MQSASKIKVVMVGCGNMSRVWLKTILSMPDVEVVGLVDIVEEMARTRVAEHSLQNVVIGSDLSDMLERTSPDVVLNCTIPEAHYAVVMAALRRGCHVLSEKPMADTMEQAREMVLAAQQAGKIFAVIQNRRYDRNIRRLRSLLASQTLGPITTVNCDFYVGAHFAGFRQHMQHVLLLDMAIHTFDAARLLTGADPVSVYCKEWNPVGSWYDHGASAVAIFEMTNGIVYTYRGSWCADGVPTTWESDWRIIAQNGSVTWDGGEHFLAQMVAETGGFIAKYQDMPIPAYDPQDPIDGHAGNIREFFSCVRTGRQPETAASDNIKSLAMVLGAIESAETGKSVAIAI
jgi:predicted dehydrogenase